MASLFNFFNGFQNMLDKISSLNNRYKIVIMDDFNAHYSEQLVCRRTPIGKKFHSFLEINNLVQLISEPTHVHQCSLTILDLLITNCSSDFSNRGILSPPSN